MFYGSVRTAHVHTTYESFYLVLLHLASYPTWNWSLNQFFLILILDIKTVFSIIKLEPHSWNWFPFCRCLKQHQHFQRKNRKFESKTICTENVSKKLKNNAILYQNCSSFKKNYLTDWLNDWLTDNWLTVDSII